MMTAPITPPTKNNIPMDSSKGQDNSEETIEPAVAIMMTPRMHDPISTFIRCPRMNLALSK